MTAYGQSMWRLVAVGLLGTATGAAGVAAFVDLASPANGAGISPHKIETTNVATRSNRGASPALLAEAAALDDDFERNAALYRLVANAGIADLERMLEEVDRLVPTRHRYDIARVLYIRFAALEPALAVDHVVNAPYHPSWVATVFRVWAHSDLDAAVASAAALRDDPKAVATRAILELGLPSGQREAIADLLADGTTYLSIPALGAVSARKAARGGHRDFAAEGEAALNATDARARGWRVGQLVRAWVSEDPLAAIAWVEGLTNARIAGTAQAVIVDALAERDPKAAVSLLAQADGLWNNRRTVTILMHALVKDGLADAIEALDAMPPRVQMSARHDLLGALRRGTGNLDFRTVLDWYELLPQAIRDKLVHSFAGAYSAHDPGQAVRWALSLEDDEAKHDALRSAMSQLGADNRDAGHRLLDVIDDPATLGIALAGFVQGYRHEDPQGAWQWAQSNRLGEHRPDSLRSAFHQWAYTSPEKATEGLLALPADLRDQTAAGIRSSTMRRLGTRRVERIFNALGSPSARRQLAKKLAEHYTLYQEDELKAEFYRSIAFESDRDNSTGSHRP